jgi:hypothetical protein
MMQHKIKIDTACSRLFWMYPGKSTTYFIVEIPSTDKAFKHGF